MIARFWAWVEWRVDLILFRAFAGIGEDDGDEG